jgi:hypothetical protein
MSQLILEFDDHNARNMFLKCLADSDMEQASRTHMTEEEGVDPFIYNYKDALGSWGWDGTGIPTIKITQ